MTSAKRAAELWFRQFWEKARTHNILVKSDWKRSIQTEYSDKDFVSFNVSIVIFNETMSEVIVTYVLQM